MDLSRGLRRRRTRFVTLGVTIGVLLLTAAAFAGASGAKSGGSAAASATPAGYPAAKPDQPWAWQKFLAQGTDAVETLGSLGIDVTEGTTKNPDGSAWISVLVTPEQRDYLEALGYRAGDVVETQAQAEAAQAEMVKVGIATMKSRRSVGKAVPHKRGFATETLKVTRADYFQSYSGTWVSVEAKSSAAIGSCQVNPTSGNCGGSNQSGTDPCLGNPAGGASGSNTAACPVLTARISTDGGATWDLGPQSRMATEVDDDTYLYHRLLIRLSNFAGNPTAPTVGQVKIWVTSQYPPNQFDPLNPTPGPVSATRSASEFVGTPPNFDGGFQHDFFNRYQTPEDG